MTAMSASAGKMTPVRDLSIAEIEAMLLMSDDEQDAARRIWSALRGLCHKCEGAGEWDEGPLPARSSAQIDPEYRQVKCDLCHGSGRPEQ